MQPNARVQDGNWAVVIGHTSKKKRPLRLLLMHVVTVMLECWAGVPEAEVAFDVMSMCLLMYIYR